LNKDFHSSKGARFTELNGTEIIANYGKVRSEYGALTERVGLLDFSSRGRLCLTGGDRIRFLHGQVTNDIKALQTGSGCYAAIVNAKGRMEADASVYCLADELLLDLEPSLGPAVATRLDKFIVADDVQVIDVSTAYGLITVLGPAGTLCLSHLKLLTIAPGTELQIVKSNDPEFSEVYVSRNSRLRTAGYDLFVPANAFETLWTRIEEVVHELGGQPVGFEAFEIARIEAGMPRFGADMDSTTFPQEAGIETRAVSYSKGCYIGQEVLNRIHTMGHVNRVLYRLDFDPTVAPQRGDKLFHDGKEVGQLTSVARSLKADRFVGLGYLRKAARQEGAEIIINTASGEAKAIVAGLAG